jgi:hypothetical protein
MADQLGVGTTKGADCTVGARRCGERDLTDAVSVLAAESLTPVLAAMWIDSPVAGLRPIRAARWVGSTLIHPGMLTFLPSLRDDASTANSESTTAETATWLWPESAAIAATRSALLIVSAIVSSSDLVCFWWRPERTPPEPP